MVNSKIFFLHKASYVFRLEHIKIMCSFNNQLFRTASRFESTMRTHKEKIQVPILIGRVT